MITDLSIRNFALIENSELTFSSGLNILSGETGAGKSILIEALSVLLGNRASLEQIRTGMNEASVSATITLDNNQVYGAPYKCRQETCIQAAGDAKNTSNGCGLCR